MAMALRCAVLRCARGLVTGSGRSIACSSTEKITDATKEILAVKSSLESALEGTSYIEESAMQLFLESDPSSREPKERYYTNYEIIARDELSSALKRLEELQNRLGKEKAEELLGQENMRIMVADCMLARDKITNSLASQENKEEAWKRGDFSSIEC